MRAALANKQKLVPAREIKVPWEDFSPKTKDPMGGIISFMAEQVVGRFPNGSLKAVVYGIVSTQGRGNSRP